MHARIQIPRVWNNNTNKCFCLFEKPTVLLPRPGLVAHFSRNVKHFSNHNVMYPLWDLVDDMSRPPPPSAPSTAAADALASVTSHLWLIRCDAQGWEQGQPGYYSQQLSRGASHAARAAGQVRTPPPGAP